VKGTSIGETREGEGKASIFGTNFRPSEKVAALPFPYGGKKKKEGGVGGPERISRSQSQGEKKGGEERGRKVILSANGRRNASKKGKCFRN